MQLLKQCSTCGGTHSSTGRLVVQQHPLQSTTCINPFNACRYSKLFRLQAGLIFTKQSAQSDCRLGGSCSDKLGIALHKVVCVCVDLQCSRPHLWCPGV